MNVFKALRANKKTLEKKQKKKGSSPIMSFCHYYDQNLCCSCSQLNIPYEEQICAKMEMIQNLLGDCETTRLQPPVCSEIIGFRNKAKMGIFMIMGRLVLVWSHSQKRQIYLNALCIIPLSSMRYPYSKRGFRR